MICRTCNQEIGNAKFCPNCGTENVVSTPVMQETPVMTPPTQEQIPNNYYQNNQTNNFAQPTNQNFSQAEQNSAMPQNQFNDQFVATQPNFVQPENNTVQTVYEQNSFKTQPVQENFVPPIQPQNNFEPIQQPFNPNVNNGCVAPQQTTYQPQQQTYVSQPENQFNVGHMNGTPQAPAVNYDKINDPAKGKATTSLVFGILALFLGWLPGIFALVFANKYTKEGNGSNKGTATAGKIMGIIGIIGGVLATIVAIVLIIAAGAGISALFSL